MLGLAQDRSKLHALELLLLALSMSDSACVCLDIEHYTYARHMQASSRMKEVKDEIQILPQQSTMRQLCATSVETTTPIDGNKARCKQHRLCRAVTYTRIPI